MTRFLVPGLVLIAACVPFAAGSPFLLNLAAITALSAALGQAWNITGGFGGMMSFGHAAFFGLGAYTGALLQLRLGINPWLGLPAAALAGGAAGALIGAGLFRAGLRGSYFALVTLAIAEAFRIVATSLDVTGGGSGLLIPLHPSARLMQFGDRRVPYLLALALAAVATTIAYRLTRDRFGARLIAVRENEDAARALGVRAAAVKTRALAISGAITAAGGVLYVQSTLYLDPNIAFSAERSVEMLLVAMVGGAGSVWGPLLGAIVLHAIADGSQSFIKTPGFAPMLYGLLLLAIIAFLPRGIARARGHA